jgi:hypothetical protein
MRWPHHKVPATSGDVAYRTELPRSSTIARRTAAYRGVEGPVPAPGVSHFLTSFAEPKAHRDGARTRSRDDRATHGPAHSEGMPAISQGLREERAPPLVTDKNRHDPD